MTNIEKEELIVSPSESRSLWPCIKGGNVTIDVGGWRKCRRCEGRICRRLAEFSFHLPSFVPLRRLMSDQFNHRSTSGQHPRQVWLAVVIYHCSLPLLGLRLCVKQPLQPTGSLGTRCSSQASSEALSVSRYHQERISCFFFNNSMTVLLKAQ